MMTEIVIESWMDAIMGRSENPVASQKIVDLCEKGKLIVVDNDGVRHTPAKLDGGRWTLEPVKG